jgi:hypothetical protein
VEVGRGIPESTRGRGRRGRFLDQLAKFNKLETLSITSTPTPITADPRRHCSLPPLLFLKSLRHLKIDVIRSTPRITILRALTFLATLPRSLVSLHLVDSWGMRDPEGIHTRSQIDSHRYKGFLELLSHLENTKVYLPKLKDVQLSTPLVEVTPRLPSPVLLPIAPIFPVEARLLADPGNTVLVNDFQKAFEKLGVRFTVTTLQESDEEEKRRWLNAV